MNLEQSAAWLHHLATIPLFSVGETQVTMASAALFLLVVIATLVTSSLAQRALARAMQLRSITDQGTVAVGRRLLHYFVLLVGLGIALQIIGIQLSTLFAAGAVFAIGFGFAMQNIALGAALPKATDGEALHTSYAPSAGFLALWHDCRGRARAPWRGALTPPPRPAQPARHLGRVGSSATL